VGVDIAPEMVRHAHSIDPAGDYRLVPDGDLSSFPDASFDLILSAFTFDNIPTRQRKAALFGALRRLLGPGGRLLNIVSAPEIYWHEWASFTTKPFPENRQARAGDPVRIIVTALEDRRPAVDILWPDTDYRAVYAEADVSMLETHQPLGRDEEPYDWVSEKHTAPWTIYVLGRHEPR
jgi:SAM-dependent methyltransferase